jgi:hypothetical protein
MLRCMLCGESFEGYVYNSGTTLSTTKSVFLEPVLCKHCRAISNIINYYSINHPDYKDIFNDMMNDYIKFVKKN